MKKQVWIRNKSFINVVNKICMYILIISFLVNRLMVVSYGNENNINYIEINEELLGYVDKDEKITDLSEIYGQRIDDLVDISYEKIATLILNGFYGTSYEQDFYLSNPISLFDANDINTYIGYNYYYNNKIGYITITTHTKGRLVNEIVEGKGLPDNSEKIYYLATGEVYYSTNMGYCTLEGMVIDNDEFLQFLEKRKMMLYNLTTGIIANMELDTVSQINNLIYLLNDNNNEILGKKYSGQDKDAYGYGGIYDCMLYLTDRYGGTISLKSAKSLPMKSFVMNTLESGASNCTLAAITRILLYYQNRGYNISMGESYEAIYPKVRAVAEKNGYTPGNGLDYSKISNVVETVLYDYGYQNSKCKAEYVWSFNEEVKKEIDGNHPVIMNIARGYYEDHTVTVCGYAIYKQSGIIFDRTHHMIQIYDGWFSGRRYIDYEAFAYDVVTSGFGSFNTIRFK